MTSKQPPPSFPREADDRPWVPSTMYGMQALVDMKAQTVAHHEAMGTHRYYWQRSEHGGARKHGSVDAFLPRVPGPHFRPMPSTLPLDMMQARLRRRGEKSDAVKALKRLTGDFQVVAVPQKTKRTMGGVPQKDGVAYIQLPREPIEGVGAHGIRNSFYSK